MTVITVQSKSFLCRDRVPRGDSYHTVQSKSSLCRDKVPRGDSYHIVQRPSYVGTKYQKVTDIRVDNVTQI